MSGNSNVTNEDLQEMLDCFDGQELMDEETFMRYASNNGYEILLEVLKGRGIDFVQSMVDDELAYIRKRIASTITVEQKAARWDDAFEWLLEQFEYMIRNGRYPKDFDHYASERLIRCLTDNVGFAVMNAYVK